MGYRIMGSYRGKTEEIDTADTKAEASRLLGEYRMAFGAGWTLWRERADAAEDEGS